MSYQDIIDWSEESYDPEDYDFFDDWLEAIKSDFARQNHYFPPETIDELRQFWNKERNDNVSQAEIRDDIIDSVNRADEFLQKSEFKKQKEIGKLRKQVIGKKVTRVIKRKQQRIAQIQNQKATTKRKRIQLKQKAKIEKIRLNRQKELIERKKQKRIIKRIKEQKAKAKRKRRVRK